MLIYTRNTMCVRCSSSIIADFFGCGTTPADSFEKILNDELNGLKTDEEDLQVAILAACTNPYVSEDVKQPDNYEYCIMKTTSPKQGADEQLLFNDATIPQGHVIHIQEHVDMSGTPCELGSEYSKHMIYHYTFPWQSDVYKTDKL